MSYTVSDSGGHKLEPSFAMVRRVGLKTMFKAVSVATNHRKMGAERDSRCLGDGVDPKRER